MGKTHVIQQLVEYYGDEVVEVVYIYFSQAEKF